jgi:hypothetical protein
MPTVQGKQITRRVLGEACDFFLQNNDCEITNPDPTWWILTLLGGKSGEKYVAAGGAV